MPSTCAGEGWKNDATAVAGGNQQEHRGVFCRECCESRWATYRDGAWHSSKDIRLLSLVHSELPQSCIHQKVC